MLPTLEAEFAALCEPMPAYRRLQGALRRILSTHPVDALPAERSIAERLGISRVTVRKAIDGLAREGLVTRRRGAGTFASEQIEKNFASLSSFTEDLRTRGHAVGNRWLRRETAPATPEEAIALGLGPGAAVHRFKRVRQADGVALALEDACVPGFALADAGAVTASLYDALAANGCRPARALQRLRAVSLTADQAQLLGATQGDPCLAIERRGFLASGRPVEWTRSWYRGEAYDFVAELQGQPR